MDDEKAIRELIVSWAEAVHAGDMDGVLAAHSDDVVMFDVPPLLRCGTPEELRQEPDRRLRLTVGLRKVEGRWLVTHEHHSFPHGAG